MLTKSERMKSKRQWVYKLKSVLGCAVCGVAIPEALQFHHLEDHVKEKSISRLLSNNAGLPKIMQEIEKCSCLCSNHHLMLHSEKYEMPELKAIVVPKFMLSYGKQRGLLK